MVNINNIELNKMYGHKGELIIVTRKDEESLDIMLFEIPFEEGVSLIYREWIVQDGSFYMPDMEWEMLYDNILEVDNKLFKMYIEHLFMYDLDGDDIDEVY